ncbi:MAG: branched-chain amino acid ABC transporter permease [Geminicoccaceae bacterium]|jgi:branched-chain amino acid transport system permease protein/neutral amino acid transport system permease protein
MIEILQLLLYGTLLGSIIALGAVGVTLTFGILGFANFAHGDLMAFGAYVCFLLYTQLAMPFWLGLVAAVPATILLAVVVDRVLYRRFRASRPIISLISSFGAALIIRSSIQIIWGPGTWLYSSKLVMAQRFEGIRYKPDQLLIIAATIVVVIALHLFLQRTRVGKAMRAMADNATLARLSGIDTERVILWTWVIGGGLAALAGVFLAMDTRLQPEMGWFLLLACFAAAILGGIGKPMGAIAGGYIIGMMMELSTLVLPAEYSPVVPFAIMVLLLLVRPTGLFAGRST